MSDDNVVQSNINLCLIIILVCNIALVSVHTQLYSYQRKICCCRII